MKEAPPKGARPAINYGYSHGDQMSAARELMNDFSSGGKDKGNYHRGSQKKNQNHFHEQPRGQHQMSSQDRHSSHCSDQGAERGPPPPSKRNYDHLGSFAPGARQANTAMGGLINDAARAFLSYKDKSESNPAPTNQAEVVQSTRPTKSAQSTANPTMANPTMANPTMANPTMPASSATQTVSVNRQSAPTRTQVVKPAAGSSPQVVDTGNLNDRQRPVVTNQQALRATSKTINPPGPASAVVQSATRLAQDAAADPNVPLVTRQVEQRVTTQTNAGAPTNVEQAAGPNHTDVLEQLRKKFLSKGTAFASVKTTTDTVASSDIPPATNSTNDEVREGSTDLEVVSKLEKLTLDDSKGHSKNIDAVTPPQAIPDHVRAPASPQKPSTHVQKRTLLPKGASSWLQESTEKTLISPPTPTQSKETSISPSTPPQKKKGPGLESSMWASDRAQKITSKENDPNFNAQAQPFEPSTSGNYSQAHVVVKTSMGTVYWRNNHPYQGPAPSQPSSSTMRDHGLGQERKEMSAAPAARASQLNERKGLKDSCWNFSS